MLKNKTLDTSRSNVGSLFLDSSHIDTFFLMPYWNLIDPTKTRVDDIMYPLIQDDKSMYDPQFAVVGKFVCLHQNQKRIFNIDTTGPHILYVTEVPKGADTKPYRLNNLLWASYWEDNRRGYLYQIISR